MRGRSRGLVWSTVHRPRDAAILHVYVQPRASRTEVAGRHGNAIKIRVKAPPVDGAANDELIRFLARRLGVPRASVTIAAGASGRAKRVRVDGMSATMGERVLLGE